MGWIFLLARLTPIKFLALAGLLHALHSHWSKRKKSLHDRSAANCPSFHPSSQPECALSGLLLWCCMRQLWNNNLKTALKPAKGKTSSCYCAIVQIRAMALQGSWRWAHEPPDSRPQAASRKAKQRESGAGAKLRPPILNRSLLWVQRGRIQPRRSSRHLLGLNNGGLRGGKKVVCVCVHLSIRELKLGMRGTQGD